MVRRKVLLVPGQGGGKRSGCSQKSLKVAGPSKGRKDICTTQLSGEQGNGHKSAMPEAFFSATSVR